jgi:hypothetical protein
LSVDSIKRDFSSKRFSPSVIAGGLSGKLAKYRSSDHSADEASQIPNELPSNIVRLGNQTDFKEYLTIEPIASICLIHKPIPKPELHHRILSLLLLGVDAKWYYPMSLANI